jgi:SAM-dependent methyltransferase
VLELGQRRFVRCAQCGVQLLDPAPEAVELEKEYGADYPPFALAAGAPGVLTRFRTGWYTGRKVRWIRGLRFRSVLDVGCGTGEFLISLRRRGIDVHGLEPSTFAASHAAAAGLDIFQGDVGDYSAGRQFDLITLWNVIEHMRKPTDDLGRLRNLLAPGGTIVVLTPDAGSHQARAFGRDWAGLEVPKHLQLFDGPSLRALATNAGLSQVEVRPARVDHLYMGLVSLRSVIRRQGLLKAARLASAVFSGSDSMLVAWLRETDQPSLAGMALSGTSSTMSPTVR